jgi:hypothetical protein
MGALHGKGVTNMNHAGSVTHYIRLILEIGHDS